ncbi:hypothetical protein EUX98_g2349 [Antrodiella citrinella]|uniref:RING-type domain-containing protein n=1 Tax=Antrodiella citrinella TaxID=2447956 RepID=A0A4S4N0L3_9APHY|nr:hypothetical protein EUX98_g2349 [Antrodiella citrinella]
MDSTAAHIAVANGSQSSKRRHIPDSSDEETDREDVKRMRSASVLLGNDGAVAEGPGISAQETSKANKDKKKRSKKKKKRKLSLVEESARAEAEKQPPVDRRSSTRPPASKASSMGRATSHVSETRGDTPAAGPSRKVQEALTAPNKAQTEEETHDKEIDNINEDGVVERVAENVVKLDKGKAKASSVFSRPASPAAVVNPQPIASSASEAGSSSSATIVDLQTQLTAQQTLLSTLLSPLTCRVCLYLMNRPFALAPCGHVVCYTCLVSWFSAPPQHAAPDQDPLPEPEAPNGNGNAQADNEPHENDPVLPPLRLNRNSAIRRKKTCPHCRAVVRERPVEVWSVKEMVASVTKSGLVQDKDLIGPATPDPPASEDPWKDIFPAVARPHAGIGHGGEIIDGDLPAGLVHDLMGFQDLEDGGVYRCVDCLHEIFDGLCSHCHREYEGHMPHWGFDGSGSESDDYLSMEEDMRMQPAGIGRLGVNFLRAINAIGRIGGRGDEGEGDEEGSEGSYGGSFIDDDEIIISDEEVDDDSDVQVLAHPGPALQNAPRRRRGQARFGPTSAIVISDDEEEQDEGDAPNMPAPSRRRVRDEIVISDDEDAESDDLADAVAARERAMYGDDGSLPARASRSRTRRRYSVAPEDIVNVSDSSEDEGSHLSDERGPMFWDDEDGGSGSGTGSGSGSEQDDGVGYY